MRTSGGHGSKAEFQRLIGAHPSRQRALLTQANNFAHTSFIDLILRPVTVLSAFSPLAWCACFGQVAHLGLPAILGLSVPQRDLLGREPACFE